MREVVPAERVGRVEEYYFSRKLKEVSRLRAAGRDIINLGVGSPDLPPSPAVIETLCGHARRSDAHGYQPYTGIKELRAGYGGWYKRWYGVELDSEVEILPLIGSKEGILHISLAFMNVGDKALVPNPGYPTYTSVTKLVGCEAEPYELSEAGGWKPDFEALERKDLSRVKLMWVNYPHMPTGTPGDAELFAKLVSFGRRHGIVICHDNPYSFILNARPESILQTAGAKEVCIELNSMSKSHNMPGWRMAMLASNAKYVEWVLRVKSNVDSGQFQAMQYAAVRALELGEEWYAGMNEVYASRREAAGEVLEAMGCVYAKNQVGLFLWGRIPSGEASVESLTDRILYGADVFVTPGMIFGSGGSGYVRVSLCCEADRLLEAASRIRGLCG
jgi:aspartate/methionine/tyrosine aminotransferase